MVIDCRAVPNIISMDLVSGYGYGESNIRRKTLLESASQWQEKVITHAGFVPVYTCVSLPT